MGLSQVNPICSGKYVTQKRCSLHDDDDDDAALVLEHVAK